MSAYILGSDTNTGESLGSAITTILKNSESEKFPQFESTYSKVESSGADVTGNNAREVFGTDSLFNPFYNFRYAKFGATDGSSYRPDNHRDLTILNATGNSTTRDTPALITDINANIENPSASEIIRVASAAADSDLDGTTLGPAPYQWNDFLWCKFYGKIPNNRLLTLRRYPIPVEDSLQIAQSKMPLVPIAQAVTWWGDDTGNALSSILGMTYGFNWLTKTAEVKNVTGNEITSEALLDSITLGGTKGASAAKTAILAALFDASSNPLAASGADFKAQEWLKGAYGEDGQYWNRVLGPVNVIDSTQIRNKGFKFTHEIKLKFTYKLRSFSNINPKIAMLDLITNFLALTHNTAEFWGGSIRYFQKTGYILPGLPTDKFDKGDYIGGIQDVTNYMTAQFQGKSEELNKLMQDISKNFSEDDLAAVAADLASSNAAKNLAGAWVKDIIQAPLQMRAFLDGRAVGEWHLTVGNPMNPFAVIGNLCLKETTIKFSESLGIDDFPTEVDFTVTLDPGRPRAKQDIESMFNLGGGPMNYGKLPPPSSAFDSLGEHNSITANNARNGTSSETPNGNDVLNENRRSVMDQREGALPDGSYRDKTLIPNTLQEASSTANVYRPRVKGMYGEKFAKSEILLDYFRQLKTKD